jgi:hypothetical protein
MKKRDLINIIFIEKAIKDEDGSHKNWLPYFPTKIQESILKQRRHDSLKETWSIDDFINYNLTWSQTVEGQPYWSRMCDTAYVLRSALKKYDNWENLYNHFFNLNGKIFDITPDEELEEDEMFRDEEEDERF